MLLAGALFRHLRLPALRQSPIMDEVSVNVPKDRSVTLILSHKCNLACSYCYQRAEWRDSALMSLPLAQKLLEKEFSKVPEGGSLGIVLMGGEPFVEWPLFRSLCEWILAREWPRPFRIVVSTNGTLVAGEIKDWLKRHKDRIILGLSYDGNGEMQEENRHTGQFNIDLPFFLETWGRQGVKMTLSPQTVGTLFDGLKYLHEECGMGHGFRSDTSMDENAIGCNLAYGVDFGKEDYLALKRELAKCVEWYLSDGKDYTPATILNLDLSYCPPEVNPGTVHKYCGVGTAMVCYDVDGTEYPCQFFLPLTQPVDNLRHIPEFDFAGDVGDPACRSCPIETLCPTCYGNNFLRTGNPFVRDKTLCPFFKLIFLANCILQTRRLLPKRDKTDKEIYSLRVIQKIYPRLLEEVERHEAGWFGANPPTP